MFGDGSSHCYGHLDDFVPRKLGTVATLHLVSHCVASKMEGHTQALTSVCTSPSCKAAMQELRAALATVQL
jgi:hypothetical protein